MILRLNGKKGRLLFYLTDDGFTSGYTAQWEHVFDNTSGIVHPVDQLWRGGTVNDLSVSVELMAGGGFSGASPTPEFSTPVDADELQRNVGTLFAFATPFAKPNDYPDPVELALLGKNGQPWYSESGYVKDVKATWLPPWDVNTGQALRCKVSFDFIVRRFDKGEQSLVGKDWSFINRTS